MKNEKRTVRFSDLYELMPEEKDELSLIAEMETDENKRFDRALYFNDCVKIIKEYNIDKMINALTEEFKKQTDSALRKQCAEQLSVLLKEKNKLG